MSINILVGTPCYGGLVNTNYLHSLLALGRRLRERNIQWELMTTTKESLITRARNGIVATFLGRPEMTHLLFIDADIGFDPEAVLRMIDFDQPLTATAYPKKGIDWDRAVAAAKNGKDEKSVERASLSFAFNLHGKSQKLDNNEIQVKEGFIQVEHAATGLMLIKREVFDQMMEAFPEDKYVNDVGGYDNQFSKDNFWLFFDCIKHPESGCYLSEDYTFCHKWIHGCNGEIFLNVTSEISHIGPYEFKARAVNPADVKPPQK